MRSFSSTNILVLIIANLFFWTTICCLVRVVALQTHPVVVRPDLEELSEESIENADVECNGEQKWDDVDRSEDKKEI